LAAVPGLAPYSADEEMAYFDKTRPLRARSYRELWDHVPRWLGNAPASLLDVGCGDGLLMQIAQAAGAEVTGIEVSQTMLSATLERCGPGTRVFDCTQAVGPASYDVVALINVLEHLPAPRRALDDMARVLRPGGLLLVHVPNFGGLPRRLSGARWHQIEPLAHYYYFTAKTLTRLLAASGLQVVDRFSLVVANRALGAVQRLAGRLGIYLDSGLGLVAIRPPGRG
jgi:2-polyprenyl-3-methyl-5-hydroxy-6-metoxy-1,4-benzoquinol methylase